MYGCNQPETQEFGHRCLLARRMLEKGVRFVQLYSETLMDGTRTTMCFKTTPSIVAKPICQYQPANRLEATRTLDDNAGNLGGEFGRMPMSESGKGRDHNPWDTVFGLQVAL